MCICVIKCSQYLIHRGYLSSSRHVKLAHKSSSIISRSRHMRSCRGGSVCNFPRPSRNPSLAVFVISDDIKLNVE
jgi:hypothetical protein